MKKEANTHRQKTVHGKAQVNPGQFQKKDFFILSAVFFIIAFVYFFFAAGHVLSFQEEQFLFLFSEKYMAGFLSHPGGLLEYAGRFLTQFYLSPLAGSLLVAMALTLPGILVFLILGELNVKSVLVQPISIIIPGLLLLMQNQYYHFMEYNLGFSIILVYFLVTFRFRKMYLHVIFFPLLYYIAGAFALVYAGMDLIYSLSYNKGTQKAFSVILPVIALITFVVFGRFLFLVPAKSLLTCPLPIVNERSHRLFLIAVTIFTIIFPLLSRWQLRKRSANTFNRYAGSGIAVSLVALSLVFLAVNFDPSISSVMSIQRSAYKGDWDSVIKLTEKHPADNLISQYFYNTALSEKGLLCDKLFSTDQNFGTKGLILPWGDQYLERGAYFFYTAGLVNEAQRWAYEEMVVYGFRPHNLQMLIKTCILDGKMPMAHKYINILRKTMFYRGEARKYEKMAEGSEAVLSDPELGPITRIMPEKDFFIYMDSPEDNLPMLYESNPKNHRAFEYMLSWLLLEKDVETVLSNIHLMKDLGYTRLPRYIEEAVMIYYNSQRVFPEMNGFTVSPATLARFDQYFSTFVQARNNPAKLQKVMKERFGDTFWYYYHFHK